MANDILIISCARSVAGPKEILLGYRNCNFRESSWQ